MTKLSEELVPVDQARDRRVSPGQCFSDLSGHQNPLEDLLKHNLLAPLPEFLIQ